MIFVLSVSFGVFVNSYRFKQKWRKSWLVKNLMPLFVWLEVGLGERPAAKVRSASPSCFDYISSAHNWQMFLITSSMDNVHEPHMGIEELEYLGSTSD